MLRGTLSQLIVFHFLYFSIEEKMCAVHLEKYIFYARFFIFTLFTLRCISTQSDFGANKSVFKHFTLPTVVSLASFTAPRLTLIRI